MSSTLRPLCRVLINGASIEAAGIGTKSTETTRTNYARGDEFSAALAFDTRTALPEWADPADTTTRVEATVQASIDGGATWQTDVVGLIDRILVDPIRGEIEISGRDYSALLIDLRVQDGWLNQRSGEVVSDLAARAGLSANVQTQGSVTGQYYQIGHKRSALATSHRFTTAWEVVRYLANAEGCDAYMTGKTLNFVPSLSDASPAYPVTMGSDANGWPTLTVDALQLERNLLIAKGIVVQVLSWEPRQRTATSVFWSQRGQIAAGAYQANQQGQLYVFKEPGLTKDQAGARAQQLYRQIVAHQRTATIEMPLDYTLSPRQAVVIQGTGTSFDGRQRIDSITRRIGFDGAGQTLVLRNRDVTEDVEQ